jgi:hypothetical protein
VSDGQNQGMNFFFYILGWLVLLTVVGVVLCCAGSALIGVA